MYKASYIKRKLVFNVPAGTSRGILNEKESWFLKITEAGNRDIQGIGECSLIPGLSWDDRESMDVKLDEICQMINEGKLPSRDDLSEYPAIQFGYESAMLDLRSGGRNLLFQSDFTRGVRGIPINGLIWMGSKQSMLEQVAHKIDQGFKILKLKVGAIDYDEEIEILRSVRKNFNASKLEIRLDANGAWTANEALAKLDDLSGYDIHSIEQPIAARQRNEMAEVCKNSPIRIALDEELIGISANAQKQELLSSIKPAYIILKPSLLGGFKASEEWIKAAGELGISWWVTSALESNLGLSAIAQWTATLETTMPQGLGTGMLFKNNFSSPLKVVKDKLFYMPGEQWDISELNNQ